MEIELYRYEAVDDRGARAWWLERGDEGASVLRQNPADSAAAHAPKLGGGVNQYASAGKDVLRNLRGEILPLNVDESSRSEVGPKRLGCRKPAGL